MLALTIVSVCALIFSSCEEKPAAVKKYNIVFQDEDGTVLQESEVKQGDVPVYEGLVPTKESTNQYDYAWNGWDNEIVAATQDQTYVAVYESVLKQYHITFKNGDGSILEEMDLEYGATPTWYENPTKAETVQYNYEFTGWNPSVHSVTDDQVYEPVFDENIQEYHITFVDEADNILQEDILPYGELPVYEGDTPTKEDGKLDYVFTDWDKEIVRVVGDETYKACFAPDISAFTKVADYSVNSSAMALDEDATAPLGFEQVYSANPSGINNGQVGVDFSISNYDKIFFALYHEADSAYVFGGGADNPIIEGNSWYHILLLREATGFAAYYKKDTETAWNTSRTKVDGKTDTNFKSILRLYNWDNPLGAVKISCSEVYAYTAPHEHTPDAHGICTSCYELVGGEVISNKLFATTLDPNNNPEPTKGFTQSVKSVAKHNDTSYVESIDISAYSKLYFALYAAKNFRVFSNSSSNKSFSSGRWNYFYMEKIEGVWHAYGRAPTETSFTELTMDNNQSSDWRTAFLFFRTMNDNNEFNVHTSELIGIK